MAGGARARSAKLLKGRACGSCVPCVPRTSEEVLWRHVRAAASPRGPTQVRLLSNRTEYDLGRRGSFALGEAWYEALYENDYEAATLVLLSTPGLPAQRRALGVRLKSVCYQIVLSTILVR